MIDFQNIAKFLKPDEMVFKDNLNHIELRKDKDWVFDIDNKHIWINSKIWKMLIEDYHLTQNEIQFVMRKLDFIPHRDLIVEPYDDSERDMLYAMNKLYPGLTQEKFDKIFKNMLQQRLVFINNVKEYTLIPTNRILIKSMDDTDLVFDIQYNYVPHFRFNYKYFENIVKNYNLDIIDLKNLMKHILYNRLRLNVQPIACNMP